MIKDQINVYDILTGKLYKKYNINHNANDILVYHSNIYYINKRNITNLEINIKDYIIEANYDYI